MDEQLDCNPTVIDNLKKENNNKNIIGYYNLQGIKLNSPSNKNITIIRYNDGSSRKILIKNNLSHITE